MRLDVVMASDDFDVARAQGDQLARAFPGWRVTVNILLQGHSAPLPRQWGPVRVFLKQSGRLPIHVSRNLCQAHLQRTMYRHGSIGMILDDDLVWIGKDILFKRVLQELEQNDCDMAVISLAGDPPIPAEYTRACPLLDLLLEMRRRHSRRLSPTLTSRLAGIHLCTGGLADRMRPAHHDYYSFLPNRFRPSRDNIPLTPTDLETFLWRLELGKATTRPVPTPQDIQPATGRERGGATLILNPQVLSIPNRTLVVGNLIARRSDMIMAMQARQAGFRIMQTPALFRHERRGAPHARLSAKLNGDIVGYALAESQAMGTAASQVFARAIRVRLARTDFLLRETIDLLRLLEDNLGLFGAKNGEHLDWRLQALRKQTRIRLEHLRGLDPERIVHVFDHWLRVKAEIVLPCKVPCFSGCESRLDNRAPQAQNRTLRRGG